VLAWNFPPNQRVRCASSSPAGWATSGSHTCVELAREGHSLRIVDNLANAKASVLARIHELAPGAEIEFVRADVRDGAALKSVFSSVDIEAVVQCWRLDEICITLPI